MMYSSVGFGKEMTSIILEFVYRKCIGQNDRKRRIVMGNHFDQHSLPDIRRHHSNPYIRDTHLIGSIVSEQKNEKNLVRPQNKNQINGFTDYLTVLHAKRFGNMTLKNIF